MSSKFRILVATVITGAMMYLAGLAVPADHPSTRSTAQVSANDLTWG
ncbi:hypothetical protein ACWDZ8_17610 [Streptomyces sp. NPDC003233]